MEAKVTVKVLQDFRDRENNLKLVKKGAVMKVSKKRAIKLSGLQLAEEIHDEKKKG